MTRLSLVGRQFAGFSNALSRQLAAYRATDPSVAVDFTFLDVPPLYEAMVQRGGARRGDHDLFLAVTDWLPRLIRDSALVPLDEFLRRDSPPDWPDGWPLTLRRLQQGPDGRTYGIAYHNGPEVFMYRTDLFEDPREQAHFRQQYGRDLGVPSTWSEFLDDARFFTRPSEELFGCVVAAKPDGHNDVYDFVIQLTSRGGALLDGNMRPAFAGPEGQAALQFYVDLIRTHAVTQPNAWEYESVAAGEFYASGRAAMMWNWCGFMTVADLPSMSRIPGRTRATMLPAGDGPRGRAVSLIVYWVMSICAGSLQPAAAWSFLRHLATPEMDLVTTFEGGSGTRLSTWRDASVQRAFPYYSIIEEVHSHVETMPSLPEYPRINDVLNVMMERAVQGTASVSDVLRDAAAETESILAEAGYYAARAS